MPLFASMLGSVTFFALLALGAQVGGPRGYGIAACGAAAYVVIVGALLRLPWRGVLLAALGALPLAIVFIAASHEPQPLRAVLTGLPAGLFGYCLMLALRSAKR